MKRKILFILFITLTYSSVYSQKNNLPRIATDRDTITIDYDFIFINNIKMWIGNNGDGSHDPNTGGSGLYWPADSNSTLVYEDGLVWGLKVNGEIRVNGNTHRQGLTPGAINNPNSNSNYRIYKVRKDWESLPEGNIKDEYKHDYINWPTEDGAPWLDHDNDGIYTPFTDEPNWHGDEMLFYVANDLDSAATYSVFQSYSIGLEQQCLTYGYKDEEFLDNVVFKKYKIINKSENDWTDMYLSYWADGDLGGAADDFVGCDTLLNLGFTYNGEEEDYVYGIPPAVGHLFLNSTSSFGDSISNIQIMTSFVPLIKHSQLYDDPHLGQNPAGWIYNLMHGKAFNGEPYLDPNTGEEAIYCLAGDPVAGTGWYEGDGWPNGNLPYDRRFLMSSGPFILAAGDTQEVVYAIIAAQGTDRLNSLQKLKNTAKKVTMFYNGHYITDVEDEKTNQLIAFKLEQNYPNPFNPATKINYSIPLNLTNSYSAVRLVVYDVLGKEVVRLVNEKMSPGNYEVIFNASVLSSGVYFYRLQSGSFIQTKKMVLLK